MSLHKKRPKNEYDNQDMHMLQNLLKVPKMQMH